MQYYVMLFKTYISIEFAQLLIKHHCSLFLVKLTYCWILLWEANNMHFIKTGLLTLLDLLALLFPFWHIFQFGFFHWWKCRQGAPRIVFQLPGHQHKAWHPLQWPAAAAGAISHQTAYFVIDKEHEMSLIHWYMLAVCW